MKIKNTLVALMLVVSLVPLLFSAFLQFNNAAATVEHETDDKLRLVVYGAQKNVYEFLSDRKGISSAEMHDRFLAEETLGLGGVSEGKLLAGSTIANRYLNEKKAADPSVVKMHMMDLSGRIVASTDESELGSFKHARAPHFLRGLEGPYVEDYHGNEELELSISGPVKTAEGVAVGVLEYDYDLNKLKSLLTGDLKKVLGAESLEAEGIDFTVANDEGNVVFCSKESHEAQQEIAAFASKKCEGNASGFSGTFADSSGNERLAAAECVRVENDWHWAFVVSQEKKAALAPVMALSSTMFIIAIVSAIAAMLIAVASISRITLAIETLTKTVNEMSQGNLGAEFPASLKESEDEIGELARAFDRTIVSLKIAMKQTAPQLKMEKLMAEKELEAKGQMLDLANDAVFLIGPRGAIHYANKKAQEFCKCDPESLQSGKCKLDEFVAPEQKRIVPKKISEVLEKGSARFQIAFEGKDRLTLAEANAKTVDLKGNKMLLVVARDVSEREKLMKEKLGETEKFKRIFELSPEAIVLVGKDRKIIDVNPRCLDWIGYERGEIIGKSFLQLPFLSAATKALMAAKFIQRMAGVRLAPYEIDMIPKAGGKVRVRLVGTAVAGKEGSPAFDLVMMSKIGNTGKNGRQ